MKALVACGVLALMMAGCAKHELVSVEGKDTNRWKVVKDWNGKKGWIGASYNDDSTAVTFESFNGDNAITFLMVNATSCRNELSVDGAKYEATSSTIQRAGYSECYTQVFGEQAFEIAAKMAMSKTMSFNGHDVDVRGFDSIMNNYFLKGGTTSNQLGAALNGAVTQPGLKGNSQQSFIGIGNWKVTEAGSFIMAGLKAVSTDKAAIMLVKDGNESIFSYSETLPYDISQCKGEIAIENEQFKVITNEKVIDGEKTCSYVLNGNHAKNAIQLIGSKNVIYIDGVVFDTTGIDELINKI